jgi:hypothetical protein
VGERFFLLILATGSGRGILCAVLRDPNPEGRFALCSILASRAVSVLGKCAGVENSTHGLKILSARE